MLYPIQNQCRTLMDLSGFWEVTINKSSLSNQDKFKIAVPASLNDQILDEKIRSHVGDFVYETIFSLSKVFVGERIVLRFGSVTHSAKVYLNDQFLGEHIGGFTPFEFEITDNVVIGENKLIVIVNNILNESTLPVGVHLKEKDGEKVIPMFDFYNYCGINRPVYLYATSKTYIKDIIIHYKVNDELTVVNPEVEINGDYSRIKLELLDQNGEIVSKAFSLSENLIIENTKRWHPLKPYLYKLRISLFSNNDSLIDTYDEEFGVRTILIDNNKLLINGEPIYLKGFGRHEDFPILGKGMNPAVINFDHNVMKWMGANSFRTSHYPYSEEEMRLADKNGFLVINEVPGVGLFSRFNPDVSKNNSEINTWSQVKTQETHATVIKELVGRDKNHPSVIAWAIANEPASHQKGAKEYFEPLFNLIKEIDHESRPVVVPNIVNATPELDEITQFTDIICLNRYYGWYIDHGEMEVAVKKFEKELNKWHEKYPNKPIMMSEFGVDTVPGMHSLYTMPYSEEFQKYFYDKTFEVLDKLDYIIGEHLWNFADFSTASNIRRIDGNLKGIFSRDRRPKLIVSHIKKRWENK